MKITKELLTHFNVISFNFEYEKKDVLCFLDRIDKGLWTFVLPKKIICAKNTELIIKIIFFQNICGEVCVNVIDSGEDWIEVKPISFTTKEAEDFLKELDSLELKYESFGRRKEERIKIGKEKSKAFGLSDIQQLLFSQGGKNYQPCVVLDVSMHGICIITSDTPLINTEDNLCLKLTFENPEQTVLLKIHKVYSRLKKTDEKNFSILSCQLLEPIHFEWKERVIKMLRNIS